MRAVTIDCDGVSSEADFWERYVVVAEPEGAGYFGQNLDAFWDGLNGGPGWPGECELHFVNTHTLSTFRGGRFLAALKEIARDSQFVRVLID
ncbi:barstar family protein [Duganella sp. LX20W]|uniref:Barstar family protein n=1 Tax=Rugamonas brunnea TaxID=2758569 RepID=A0A7W2EVR8_9BURK|nr:barstar family protein [Rugamonas brunnea]